MRKLPISDRKYFHITRKRVQFAVKHVNTVEFVYSNLDSSVKVTTKSDT